MTLEKSIISYTIELTCTCIEIGMCLFDSYAIVNPFITWRNFILKDRPEKERKWVKYGIREARLKLITRWVKRCGRHYKQKQPHRKKRQRRVLVLFLYVIVCIHCLVSLHELNSMPLKPGSLHHDEPLSMPVGSGHCVICGKKTKNMCWGCTMDLGHVFPVCPTSQRDCIRVMHDMRNEIRM